MQKHRDSMKQNFYTVWKLFNKFLIRLDKKPHEWEHRLILFVGHLIDENKQSSTVKSYVSAIRAVLKDNNIDLNEDQYLISSLTKVCRLVNDQIRMQLLIQKVMLSVLLKQMEIHYTSINQTYLKILNKALLSTTYFGLFRIGELTSGKHMVKARDVHVAQNKEEFLFILRTSKTHWKNMKPQIIKITSKRK